MSAQPRSAADARPNNRPYYVDPNCPNCGTALVLWDVLITPPAENAWYDEWWCRQCECIVMDWPPGEYEAVLGGEG